MKAFHALVCSLLICTPALAQGACGLTSLFTSNNGQAGNMFDVVALNPAGVTVSAIDVNLDVGTFSLEVYSVTAGGSFLGLEANPAAWTQIGVVNVTSPGADLPTPVPLPINVSIPPGGTQGFYVTVGAGATSMNYTNGTGLGNVQAADANIQILEGVGNTYLFGGTFSPRVWNGTVYYNYPGQTLDWQVNQPAATSHIDAVQATACVPAIINTAVYGCTTATPVAGIVTFETTQVGMGWEPVFSTAPLISAAGGATTLPDGQVINIDTTQPYSGYFGLTLPPFPGSGLPGSTGGRLDIVYTLTTTADLVMQVMHVDPAGATGVSLSQGSELHVASYPSAPSIAGPGNNASVAIDVSTSPTCWTATGIPFYGTTYTTMNVSSEGRVLFGGADTDSTPTLVEALSDFPFVGFWTDLDPSLPGAAITVSSPAANQVRVDYSNVPYSVQPTAINNFYILFDAGTGDVILGGLAGIIANPTSVSTTDSQFLGISPGNAVTSTDPGVTSFATGAGIPLAGSDMLYDFHLYSTSTTTALVSALQLGTINTLQFIPSATMFPNYDWAAF